MKTLTPREVREQLDIDDVFAFVNEMGGEATIQNGTIVSKTICHNPAHSDCSHKLYYYPNSHLFKCYTLCDDSFDIIELYIRYQYNTNGAIIPFKQALDTVANRFGITVDDEVDFDEAIADEDFETFERWKELQVAVVHSQVKVLPQANTEVLNHLPQPHILPWEQEGITYETLQRFHIYYDPVACSIVIPHYDIRSRLVGIRGWTLVKDEEKYGKYRPAVLDHKMWNHPLGLNLYGLDMTKDNIKATGIAVIFEGEKSVLLMDSLYGSDNNISVAICGSNLSAYQVELLRQCGAKTIILALDKQYRKAGDEDYEKWRNKLTKMGKKYIGDFNVYMLLDTGDLLGYKDSPIDCGKEIYERLMKRRRPIK